MRGGDCLSGCARSKLRDGDRLEVVGILVNHRKVLGSQVAIVGHRDGVLDGVTKSKCAILTSTLTLIGNGLSNRQIGIAFVNLLVGAVATNGLGSLTRRCDILLGLGVGDGISLSFGGIGEGAGDNVVLGNHVLNTGVERLGLTNSQVKLLTGKASSSIRYHHVLVINVAVVGHRDGIGNLLTQFVRHTISRSRSSLGYRERGVKVIDGLGIGALVLNLLTVRL